LRSALGRDSKIIFDESVRVRDLPAQFLRPRAHFRAAPLRDGGTCILSTRWPRSATLENAKTNPRRRKFCADRTTRDRPAAAIPQAARSAPVCDAATGFFGASWTLKQRIFKTNPRPREARAPPPRLCETTR